MLARSLITYANNVRCPLLVVQDANDPRVVQAESDQMVEQLRARGLLVKYLVFKDEGHGITKRANLIKMAQLIADFLVGHLTNSK